jgi:uncharacterized protein
MDKATTLERIRDLAERDMQAAGPAHDFSHVLRVTENARALAAATRARCEIVLPAALLHDLFRFPKDHPESHRSGEICADRAAAALASLDLPADQIAAIVQCIREHPFSLGQAPSTLEGRVLQDADRLDAIGAIGMARCFAVCGELNRPLFHGTDPFCRAHPPDDKSFGLDHFYNKLLRIPDGLHTEAARAMAVSRTQFLCGFLRQLEEELGPSTP